MHDIAQENTVLYACTQFWQRGRVWACSFEALRKCEQKPKFATSPTNRIYTFKNCVQAYKVNILLFIFTLLLLLLLKNNNKYIHLQQTLIFHLHYKSQNSVPYYKLRFAYKAYNGNKLCCSPSCRPDNVRNQAKYFASLFDIRVQFCYNIGIVGFRPDEVARLVLTTSGR